ncbi:MAG TPA: DUF4185 domain-containing protein, partial [Dehalococcoidia bacterium]|nr:DUF4185 domain-containing protein [Dehalococcoidia bacterium]
MAPDLRHLHHRQGRQLNKMDWVTGPVLRAILGVLLFAGLFGTAAAQVRVDQRSTQKVCQVVGEFDRQWGRVAFNRTEERARFWGTDLGASFEHEGKLVVVFGDTHPVAGIVRPRDADAIAFSDTVDPEGCLQLDFLMNADGGFRPLTIPGVYAGAFAVPTGGFSLNGAMYVLTTSDVPGRGPMARSVLARSDDGGWTFHRLYDLSTERLVHVSPVMIPADRVAGVPDRREGILFWGTGPFRRSNAHLAFIPAAEVENPAALRHFAGLDQAGQPIWSADERDSAPLFDQPCMGEFSAGWNEFLSKWMLLYTCGGPRAVLFLRTADLPWGPWSPPELLFDPTRPPAGCAFLNSPPELIQVSAGAHPCPVVSDPHTPFNLGESYGPYLVSRFTRGDPGRSSTIYFLMSTWNP